MPDLVGRTIDKFKIVKELGKGGMGSVYQARDRQLQRDVALKIMHPRLARLPDFRKRFLGEARIAAGLKHPGIVNVYEFGDKDPLYIVMELLTGVSLHQFLQDLRAKQQWIALSDAVEILRQIGIALEYAHKHGVMHRDIKPDNIMLCTKEDKESDEKALPFRPVITDLGLAQANTNSGESSGTPAYMSPEQALGQPVDARSDVYSLGVLLYELALGRVPFSVFSLEQAREAHGKQAAAAPRSLRPDLPKELEQVILRSLQKEPAKRFAKALDLVQALNQVPREQLAASAPPSAQAGVASLMTQLQQSLLNLRGSSVLDDFGEFKPAGPGADHIQILAPDQRRWAVPIKGRTFTIGRGPDNDLILNDERISRNHLRVEFNGTAYRITDQKSHNGTYLGDVRLLAGSPEPWQPNKVLRVGDHHLRLVSAQAATNINQPGEAPSRQKTVDASGEQATQDTVQLHVEPSELSVEPGSQVQLQVIVSNFSEEVVHYKVGLSGIPEDWMTVTPKDFIELMPGRQGNATILIRPPRSTKVRAGRFRIAATAISREDNSQNLTTKATLTIGELGDFKIEMEQNKAKVGELLRISIRNQSNKAHKFVLSCWDEANELEFKPAKKQLEIPARESKVVEFTAQPKQHRWIGGPKEHRFYAKVKGNIGEGKEETTQGAFISQGVIPPWVPPAALAVVVAAASLGVMAYRTHQNTLATETAVARAATATVIELATEATATTVVKQTAVAGIATAHADASATAISAATQTVEAKLEARQTKEAEIALTETADARNEAKVAANAATATEDAKNATATADTKEATQTAEAITAANLTREAAGQATATQAAIMTQMASEQQTRDARATDAQAVRDQNATRDAKEAANKATEEALNAAATQNAKDAQATEEQRSHDAQSTENARIATQQAIPTSTPTPKVGRMNINRYCQATGWQQQFLDGTSAYSWRCQASDGSLGPFLTDTNYAELCVQQYGPGSSARSLDTNQAKAWVCVIP